MKQEDSLSLSSSLAPLSY